MAPANKKGKKRNWKSSNEKLHSKPMQNVKQSAEPYSPDCSESLDRPGPSSHKCSESLGSQHEDQSSDDGSFLEADPPSEFSKQVVEPNPGLSKIHDTPSPSGRKRSLRKFSMGTSPAIIPLNDDRTELIENEGQESDKKQTGSETLDLVEEQERFSNTMTKEQMREHVTRCLELSNENKINIKNAFALKLIDCMAIINKDGTENNFAAMACQLDAGAKIYSHRVDAVHQQVLKLVESCLFAEKKPKRDQTDAEDQTDEGNTEKGVKRKSKKKVLATAEQINRKLKEKDPRKRYIQLDCLPWEILNKARRDNDLSLTLDRYTQFWTDWDKYVPIKATGLSDAASVAIKKRWLGPLFHAEHNQDLSQFPKLEEMSSPMDALIDFDGCENDSVGDPEADNIEGNTIIDEIKVDEDEEDAEVVSLARSRMIVDCSKGLSRLEILKTLFHEPGENDYHYLKMDNSHYWAGPAYWKRPTGMNAAANKKKVVRKKKEPLPIEYSETVKNISLKSNKSRAQALTFKRSTVLSQRTMMRWNRKRVTFPPDIHFQHQTFHMLFFLEVDARGVINEAAAHEPLQTSGEIEVAENDGDEEEAAEEGQEDPEPPPDNTDDSEGEPEGAAYETENDDKENEENVDINFGFEALSVAEGGVDLAVPSTSRCSVAAGSSNGSCDVYEGDNLVPKPKMVKVEPIKFVAKPNQVDMNHLKSVMLAIIMRGIQDSENELRSEGVENPVGSISFRSLLGQLFSTNELHHRTREGLTVQMSFLALLTLATEHSLMMRKVDDSDEVVVTFYQLEAEKQKEPDENDDGDIDE